jgi:hypothetical protein
MFRQEAGRSTSGDDQRQLRHLAVAREMLDAGESGRRIGEALRLRDFALDKLLEQAGAIPAAAAIGVPAGAGG